MKTLFLNQEFDVALYEARRWEYGVHRHNFFELIYIVEGSGKHIINQNTYSYSKGSLYFLVPNDEHSFEIKQKTKFCIITFNRIYFFKAGDTGLSDYSNLFKKIEFILHNANHLSQNTFEISDDQLVIDTLITRVIHEVEKQKVFFDAVIQNSVLLLLTLIARHVTEAATQNFAPNKSDSTITDIIFYIQYHIYDNTKLSLTSVANTFNKSKNSLSTFFKASTGLSLKEYILDYKLGLATSRLLRSNLTISEIAHELNFTDESHLNKLFKNKYKQTAKQFRKERKSQS